MLIVGDYPIRQLILHPRILVGWFSWQLNAEVLWSLWLKASATWGGSHRPKASVKGRRAVPLLNYRSLLRGDGYLNMFLIEDGCLMGCSAL
jgi:hypothetical protein